MRRDGITPGPDAGRSQLAGQAQLMLEVLARTPLRTWTDEFGQHGRADPRPAVRQLGAGAVHRLVAGRDGPTRPGVDGRPDQLGPRGRAARHPMRRETLRQLVRRIDPALATPEIIASLRAGRAAGHPGAIRVLRFRYDMLKELDDDDSAG